MSRLQKDYQKAFATFASQEFNIGLSVQRIYPINNTLARIVAVASQGNWNARDYADALSAMYDNKVMALPNCICDVSDKHKQMVSAFVVPNTRYKDYNDDNLRGMKLVTANVFAEDGDKIWEVRGEGDDRVLVQVAGENIEDLLNERRERYSMATAAVHALDTFMDFNNGDYVLYMSTAETLRGGYGFKISNIPYVYDRRDKSLISISPYQIVNIASSLDDEYTVKNIETATLSTDSMKTYLDYMGRLFKGTSYYNRLEQLMRQKAAMPDGEDLESNPAMLRH